MRTSNILVIIIDRKCYYSGPLWGRHNSKVAIDLFSKLYLILSLKMCAPYIKHSKCNVLILSLQPLTPLQPVYVFLIGNQITARISVSLPRDNGLWLSWNALSWLIFSWEMEAEALHGHHLYRAWKQKELLAWVQQDLL